MGQYEFGGERLVNVGTPVNADHAANKSYVDNKATGGVASGALPTIQLVSGAAQVPSTARTVTTYTSVAYNNSSADATITVALSPDNSTFSTLAVVTNKTFTGAVNGNITMVTVIVPIGWAFKITTVNATLGATTIV